MLYAGTALSNWQFGSADHRIDAQNVIRFFINLIRRIFTMRTRITLACTECKQRNYDTTKDKKTHPDRMETKKYCRFCKRHTLHKETK